jgi:hypothetical protein
MAGFRSWIGLSALLGFVVLAGSTRGQPPKGGDLPPKGPAKGPAVKPGVSINSAKAFQGYTLVAPMNSNKAYLVDMEGRVVKTWQSDTAGTLSNYLLENGHLLRSGSIGSKAKLGGAGAGGRIQEFDWDGNVVWDFTYSTETSLPHHDFHRMPNGNILMIVWDKKTAAEAIAAGRRPDSVRGGSLLADAIIEVKPISKTGGEIVWEWHAWDHLVQDFDKTKANYGNVARKAELIDINFGSGMMNTMIARPADLQKLRDLGYVGGQKDGAKDKPKDGAKDKAKDGAKDGPKDAAKGGPKGGPGGAPARGPGGPSPDWTHINAVAYNAELDQIVLSVHSFSEFWIIDHSTTTKEAAGHTGGKYGKGGGLLYRWGNPRAYRSGTNADQRLFNQHNAHWIPKGHPGAGNIIVFNNGGRRPDGSYSSVDEIVLPVTTDGKYTRKPGLPFGPDKAVWSYTAPKKTDFYATFISGAHRLPNGNTLVCSGPDGTVFEVTPENETVWKFANPARGGGPGGFPGGITRMFGPPSQPGLVMPSMVRDMLRLTPEQRKKLDELQKDVDSKLANILTDEQKKQIKDMQNRFGPGGPPGFGPPGGGGVRIAGPGPGGPGGLFRSYRYGTNYPGLVGKELKPGKKLEEIETR